MKLFVTLAVVLCVSATQIVRAAPSGDIDCSKIDEVIDEMGGAQGITMLNPKYKPAVTQEEFEIRCKDMREAMTTLRKYNSKCFTSLTQQVFSAMLRTRMNLNEQYCKIGTPESKEAFEAMKCAEEKAHDAIKKAELGIVLETQVLHDSNIADEKARLRQACCTVINGKKIFMEATKVCSQYEKIYSDYEDSYTSEAMSLICPEADKLACDKLERVKTDGVDAKYKSFLNPMMKLVKTMDH